MTTHNQTSAELAKIAAPADAQHAKPWIDDGDGRGWGRFVRGNRRAAEGVAITLCGWQDSSGTVERHAIVSAADNELDAAALRLLAALVLDAADELESLGNRSA